jgi:hypothetical protein
MTEQLWFGSQEVQEIFLFSKMSRLVLCPIELTIQWVSEALFSGESSCSVKLTISPSNAEVTSLYNCILTPVYGSMAWCLIKKTRVQVIIPLGFVNDT